MNANTRASMKGNGHPNMASIQADLPAIQHGFPFGIDMYLPTLYASKLAGRGVGKRQALLQLLYPSTGYVPDLKVKILSCTVASP